MSLVEAPTFRFGDSASPEEILKRGFGFDAFRGHQANAIDALMAGEDVFLLMPTGGGKSLCYQIPALCRRGMGLVVSPLIALMDDQAAALRQLGIRAAALHSELDAAEAADLRSHVSEGTLDILMISPERLLSPGAARWLARRQISVIAIDEAHCVSNWGHEFRPDYRALAQIPGFFPGVPRIALTATADHRTQQDILHALAMEGAKTLVASFHRQNLWLNVLPKASLKRQLLSVLRRDSQDASIVYCGTRNKTERTARMLRESGYDALAFHAGLAASEKRAVLGRFRSGEPLVIVATVAFGMGIDRPDVRRVIHTDMPASLEAYYQQIGRAGRDGEKAETFLFYGIEDIARAQYWIERSSAPEAERDAMQYRLDQMIAFTETSDCRTQNLLSYFGESLARPCGHCDNCAHPSTIFDGTELAQKALSAIYRIGQRFGMRHVIEVLRGKLTAGVSQHAHQHLSVFGVGRDNSEATWRGIIRQLVAKRVIAVKGEFAHLQLSSTHARPILIGDQRVAMRAEREMSASSPALKSQAEQNSEPLSAAEEAHFERLRQWRRNEAREQEIPPYIIFHDATLREIARDATKTLDALRAIKGVGESKVKRYGSVILAVLDEKND